MLALSLLETILARRFPGDTGAEAATTRTFPHQSVSETVDGTPPHMFGAELFDEMLSYCSCLYLAQWLFDKYGEVKKAPELVS